MESTPFASSPLKIPTSWKERNPRTSLLSPSTRKLRISCSYKRSADKELTKAVGLGCNGSDESSNFVRTLKKAAIALAAAAAVSINGCDSSALAESLTVAFPASRAAEVYFSQDNQ
jgi:hypothetical protein